MSLLKSSNWHENSYKHIYARSDVLVQSETLYNSIFYSAILQSEIIMYTVTSAIQFLNRGEIFHALRRNI